MQTNDRLLFYLTWRGIHRHSFLLDLTSLSREVRSSGAISTTFSIYRLPRDRRRACCTDRVCVCVYVRGWTNARFLPVFCTARAPQGVGAGVDSRHANMQTNLMSQQRGIARVHDAHKLYTKDGKDPGVRKGKGLPNRIDRVLRSDSTKPDSTGRCRNY